MSTPLVPHLNVWIEAEGEVVLSLWRVELLEAIDETGSITAAAARMDVQYQRAWHRLDEMERGLGLRLVDRQVGGVGGGGAYLTDAGRAHVARFRRFYQAIEEVAASEFAAAFGGQS